MTTSPNEVIVTGSAVGSAETIDELIQLALQHVHRSRAEPGCISHAVYRDLENPYRLFFFERWRDRDALNTHFSVPDSNSFVAALNELTTEPASIHLDHVAPTQ